MYLDGQHASILYGVVSSFFKFNPSGSTRKKRNRVAVLHAGVAKPQVQSVTGLFTLVTPMPDIAAGEFLYRAPGGYLTIVNTVDLELTLVADDSGNEYVTTEPTASDHAAFGFSTFY